MTEQQTPLLRTSNFLWLVAGGALSMLGDQFTLIALPWLILKMTGDPLVVGTVLAIMSLPRAVLMLVGGAMVDRSSAKRVLLVTKYANALTVGLLAFLIHDNSLSLWALYLMAVVIGTVSAFSYPAGSAILPQVVQPEQLRSANSMTMSVRQISQLVGPLLAGFMIALLGDGNESLGHSRNGLAFAFLFDCVSFVVSAWTLNMVALRSDSLPIPKSQNIFAFILGGLQTLWQDRSLRAVCLYSAATTFLISGPIQVALPVIADRNLPTGAAAYGIMLGAYGAGSLFGMILSGARPTWHLRSLGTTILLIDGVVSFFILWFGYIHSVWEGAALLGILGVLGGFIQVVVYSWMQRRIEPRMIGRAMSIFMFIFVGLAPVSAALTGGLLRLFDPGLLFVGAGIALFSVVVVAFLSGAMSRVGEEPASAAGAGVSGGA